MYSPYSYMYITISVVNINVDIQHPIKVVHEVKNGQDNVIAVAEPASLIFHGVVPASIPVDDHFSCDTFSQALSSCQAGPSHRGGIIIDALK